MKIVQHHPLSFLATISYEIKGDTVVKTYKNLRSEMTSIIDIPSIHRIYSYRTGNDGFLNLGVGALTLGVIEDLVFRSIRCGYQGAQIRAYISGGMLAVAVACFLLSFVKRDWIGFQDGNNQPIFGIRQDGKPETKEFVDRIRDLMAGKRNG